MLEGVAGFEIKISEKAKAMKSPIIGDMAIDRQSKSAATSYIIEQAIDAAESKKQKTETDDESSHKLVRLLLQVIKN